MYLLSCPVIRYVSTNLVEDYNEKTDTECQEDTGDVESSEKKTVENGGEEVVTLDDEGGDEERVPTKTIPDSVFFESVSEEEKQYYEENPISADKIELMKVQCTACFKQVLLCIFAKATNSMNALLGQSPCGQQHPEAS